MKIIYGVLLSFIFFVSNSYALQLKGTTWLGTYCSSYNDGSSYGTYNYSFGAAGDISTYIEYFTDYTCTISTGTKVPQASGSYTIKGTSEGEDGTAYDLEVRYTHLLNPLAFTAIIKEDSMTLCRDKNRYCGNYKRLKIN